MQFGKSVLKSMQQCAWKWWLEHQGHIPQETSPQAAAGTAMHAAIEYHERFRMQHNKPPNVTQLEAVAYAAALIELDAISEDMWNRQELELEDYIEWVHLLVDNWWASDVRKTLLTYTPLHIEAELSADPLRGRLDWIGQDEDGELVVVDFKSAASFSGWGDPKKHALEATVYVTLAETLGMGTPRMEWHVVRRGSGSTERFETNRLIRYEVTDEDRTVVALVAGWAGELVEEGGPFPRNPKSYLCSKTWCAAYDGCQVTGVLSPQALHLPTAQFEAGV